jgi:hypothetical protein
MEQQRLPTTRAIARTTSVDIWMEWRVAVVYFDVSPTLATSCLTHCSFATAEASSIGHSHDIRLNSVHERCNLLGYLLNGSSGKPHKPGFSLL